ncbi:kelch repeat-containing protein [Bacillus altitudinis]|uniref:Kelch repeat-containing protein n=1 Tax=Bacillus altitudinis TaxID=293387 RepID=UPI0034577DBA
MKKFIFIFMLLVLSFMHSKQIANATTLEWNKLSDLPEARVGASVGVVDGKIYLAGGGTPTSVYSNKTFMYDPSIDKWTEKKEMLSPRGGAASVVVGSEIFVIGGVSENKAYNKFEVYDTKADKWTQLEDVPFKTLKGEYNVQAGLIGNKIYVLGGGNEFHSYNLETKEWKTENDPAADIKFANGVVMKDKFYVISGNKKKLVYEFDPSTNKWTIKKNGINGEYLFSTVYNGHIIFPLYNTFNVYNVEKEESNRPITPNGDSRLAASTVIINDTLYIIGGKEYNINNGFNRLANSNFKKVVSISLKDLGLLNNTETPGDKDPEPTTPPKDDNTTDEDGDALLIITMVNGLQKEYDLSMKEVNAFLSWYKKRDAGEGPGFYEIDEHDNNKGPFESKKDYVVFNNILMFEVNKYKK